MSDVLGQVWTFDVSRVHEVRAVNLPKNMEHNRLLSGNPSVERSQEERAQKPTSNGFSG